MTKETSTIAVQLSDDLRALLLASNLGLNKNHPLAGWNFLTILYHDGASSAVPITKDFLLQKYNHDYRDFKGHEDPIKDETMKHIMAVLTGPAGLVEVSPRKVRERMRNGFYHIHQSYVYRITSSGIEYLKMMQRVVDAESTVTANTNRIDEYCQLVARLNQATESAESTQFYNDFHNMVTAYDDVMKGMHKLDEDLDELANDLAFQHGSEEAHHLQVMLTDKAVPSFKKMLATGKPIKAMAYSEHFIERVARSQQGSDDLDTAHAIEDTASMLLRFNRTKDYVKRQMAHLAMSFESNASAIDTSLDSMYMLFGTIMNAVKLLGREYEHVKSQTVDVKALTDQIDALMTHYQTLRVPTQIPRHLPMDRQIEDRSDLLDATTMGPVTYTADESKQQIATEADNPVVANDQFDEQAQTAGLAEFQRLVMVDEDTLVVDHDLEFQTVVARDEVMRLYSATGYDSYAGFAPFGRPIKAARLMPTAQPIRLHCVNEQYSVFLPGGFTVDFQSEERVDD